MSPDRKEKSAHLASRWWLVALLFLTTCLAARALDADALWIDEYWTLYIAGGTDEEPLTLAEIWERASIDDYYWPPGYAFVYSIWGKMVGWTPFAGRALSLFAGLLATAWVYRLGSDLFTKRAGLISASVLATSAYFIYFFHELRGYVFYVLLIAVTMWSYWQIVHSGGKWWRYLLLFFGALGILYTNYFAALTLVTLGIYHGLFVPRNRQWRLVTATLVLAGLLFIPWLAVVVQALAFATGDTVRRAFAFTPLQSAKGMLYMFSNGCIAVLTLFGIFSLKRHSTTYFTWFLGVGIFTLLLLVNARFGVIIEVRYFLPVWTVLALIVGYGADRLLSDYRKPALGLIGLWMLAGIWNSIDPASTQEMHNRHWHLPWNVLVEQVEAHAEPDDALAFVLPDWTWQVYHTSVYDYYLRGHPLRRHILMERPLNVGYENYVQQVEALVADDPMLWVGYTSAQPTLQLEVFKELLAAQNYLHCATVYDSSVLQFDLYSPRIPQSETQPVQFRDDRITLRAITASFPLEKRRLELTQIWSVAPEVPSDTYSIGLHVDNAQGELVAQVDDGLSQPGQTCRWLSIDLAGLPAGVYRLSVVVYAWESGERLLASSGDSVNAVERFPILNFALP